MVLSDLTSAPSLNTCVDSMLLRTQALIASGEKKNGSKECSGVLSRISSLEEQVSDLSAKMDRLASLLEGAQRRSMIEKSSPRGPRSIETGYVSRLTLLQSPGPPKHSPQPQHKGDCALGETTSLGRREPSDNGNERFFAVTSAGRVKATTRLTSNLGSIGLPPALTPAAFNGRFGIR